MNEFAPQFDYESHDESYDFHGPQNEMGYEVAERVLKEIQGMQTADQEALEHHAAALLDRLNDNPELTHEDAVGATVVSAYIRGVTTEPATRRLAGDIITSTGILNEEEIHEFVRVEASVADAVSVRDWQDAAVTGSYGLGRLDRLEQRPHGLMLAMAANMTGLLRHDPNRADNHFHDKLNEMVLDKRG